MRIALLGPLEVTTDDGGLIHVAGARLRTLLIALAVDAGHVVSAARLADAVWGEDLPTGTVNALQALVSRLRRVVGSAAVESLPSGYRLAVDPDTVDIVRFERLVTAAKARLRDDPAAAAESLREASDLWRGPALLDVADQDYFAGVAPRLDGLRLAATEDRIVAELRLGRGSELVTELTGLVAEFPLRERLVNALMRALVDAGQPAEALDVYEKTRHALAERLGTDPSAELSALHMAVLRGDVTPMPGPVPAADAGLHRPVDAAPSPAADAAVPVRTNLRSGVTSFVGRAADGKKVEALVGEYRLTTLVGPGGSGKTRLAVEAGRQLLDRMPDGVWLVEFAPIAAVPAGPPTAVDLVPAVLAAMGMRDVTLTSPDPTEDSLDRLVAALRTHETLLILDNCEHVISAAAALADALLGACPRLRLIATSREPIGVAGEAVWPVEPLTLPPGADDTHLSAAALLTYDAARLLVDRARAVRPGFEPTDADADAIARICRALDGMPLAIELAAARLRSMSPVQLADRVDDRFRLLTGGTRTALPRHQTLRAVVDWSWDLLSEPERAVLRRLAIFAGGAALESAERVCADPPVDGADVLDLLTGLVDKSLVVADVKGDVPRYRMLETIKAYSLERLDAAGERVTTRRAHADAMVELAEAAEPHLRGSEQLTWLRHLAAQHDDLTGALRGAIAAGDAQTAVRIVAAAAWYWWQSGHKAEGLELAIEALRVPGDTDPEPRATACATVTFFSSAGLGDVRVLEPWIEETRRLAGMVDRPGPLVRFILAMTEAFHDAYGPAGRNNDAMARLMTDEDPWVRAQTRLARNRILDIDERIPDIELGLAEFRAAGDRWGLCYALSTLASVLALRGELTAAIGHAEQAEALLIEMNNVEDHVLIAGQLALMHWMRGDRDASAACLARADRAAAKVVWRDGLAMLALGKSDLARWSGDTVTARAELARARAAIGDMAVDPFFGAMIEKSQSFLDVAAGDLDAARTRRREALATVLQTGDHEFMAQVLVGVADQALRQGAPEDAVRLLAAAGAVVGAPEACVGDAAEVTAAARAALGDAAFTAAMGAAREEWAGMRTGEPAIAEAMRELAESVLGAG